MAVVCKIICPKTRLSLEQKHVSALATFLLCHSRRQADGFKQLQQDVMFVSRSQIERGLAALSVTSVKLCS